MGSETDNPPPDTPGQTTHQTTLKEVKDELQRLSSLIEETSRNARDLTNAVRALDEIKDTRYKLDDLYNKYDNRLGSLVGQIDGRLQSITEKVSSLGTASRGLPSEARITELFRMASWTQNLLFVLLALFIGVTTFYQWQRINTLDEVKDQQITLREIRDLAQVALTLVKNSTQQNTSVPQPGAQSGGSQ